MSEETLDPFETDKSQVRQYRNWLHERNEKQFQNLKKVISALCGLSGQPRIGSRRKAAMGENLDMLR